MQPILDLITRRHNDIQATADTLREQIAALSDQLHHAEAELADLATTRSTLTRLTDPTTPGAAPDTTIYQQIITVFDTTPDPLRAKDICQALGIGTEPKDTEGVRAKLKRLVKRGVLSETEPGLFTPANPTQPPEQTTTSVPNPTPNPTQT